MVTYVRHTLFDVYTTFRELNVLLYVIGYHTIFMGSVSVSVKDRNSIPTTTTNIEKKVSNLGNIRRVNTSSTIALLLFLD
jgi:hypothetical protein